MSSESDSDRLAAARLWNRQKAGTPRLALLTTVGPDGGPHATWMGMARTEEEDTVLTITSPDSDKVRNIRAQPRVEWLITSSDRKELLYLNGKAEVIDDVPEMKRCWKMMPGKEKAFFLRYYNSGIGFSVIRTKVESVVYVVPEECRKTRYSARNFKRNGRTRPTGIVPRKPRSMP